MTLFPVGGTWSLASVTPLSPRVPLAGGSDDFLLLLIPVWPQHPLLGLHHLCNQFLALNCFSFAFLNRFYFAWYAELSMRVCFHKSSPPLRVLHAQADGTDIQKRITTPQYGIRSFLWTQPCLHLPWHFRIYLILLSYWTIPDSSNMLAFLCLSALPAQLSQKTYAYFQSCKEHMTHPSASIPQHYLSGHISISGLFTATV